MSTGEVVAQVSEKLSALSGTWAVFTVFGSFLLYVLGYLALRFHLTALGLGTDLAVLDERYLFAGARFLIYLCAMILNVVLLVLLAAAIIYVPYRVLPARLRECLRRGLSGLSTRCSQPSSLTLLGIVFAVIMIQFFMRDCLELSNLLLRSSFDTTSRLGRWLLQEGEGRIALFFTGLVAGCAASSVVLLSLWHRASAEDIPPFLYGLLVFLIAVQVLLLPINYGVLVLEKTLPRVASLDGVIPLAPETEAWLVWEGKEGMTYLLRRKHGGNVQKSLLTIPRNRVEKVEIIAYDRILPRLFAPIREQ